MNQLLKDSGIVSKDMSHTSEAEAMKSFEQLLPELRAKDAHRLIHGYPRTISQVHHLRKLSLYPHKVFVINADLKAAASRVCQKLFNKTSPETSGEQRAVDCVMQEYQQ